MELQKICCGTTDDTHFSRRSPEIFCPIYRFPALQSCSSLLDTSNDKDKVSWSRNASRASEIVIIYKIWRSQRCWIDDDELRNSGLVFSFIPFWFSIDESLFAHSKKNSSIGTRYSASNFVVGLDLGQTNESGAVCFEIPISRRRIATTSSRTWESLHPHTCPSFWLWNSVFWNSLPYWFNIIKFLFKFFRDGWNLLEVLYPLLFCNEKILLLEPKGDGHYIIKFY